MKVVTLCGSMRFSKQMHEIATELEIKQGYCALTPVGDADIALGEVDKESLAKAHFKKIDLSDAVYIVNIDGYIGESVSKELIYAQKNDKEIIYHEKIKR